MYDIYINGTRERSINCDNDQQALSEIAKFLQQITVFGKGANTSLLMFNKNRLICDIKF